MYTPTGGRKKHSTRMRISSPEQPHLMSTIALLPIHEPLQRERKPTNARSPFETRHGRLPLRTRTKRTITMLPPQPRAKHARRKVTPEVTPQATLDNAPGRLHTHPKVSGGERERRGGAAGYLSPRPELSVCEATANATAAAMGGIDDIEQAVLKAQNLADDQGNEVRALKAAIKSGTATKDQLLPAIELLKEEVAQP